MGAILVTIFWTKSAKVMVTGHRWERSIEIQAYQAIEEGSWCNQVPAEAYDMRQEQRQRGTTQVRDGEDCSDMNVDNRDGRSDAVNLATDPSRLTTPTATIPSIGGSTRAGSTTKGNPRIPLPPGPSYLSRAANRSDAHDRERSEVSMYSSTKSPWMAPLARRTSAITRSPYGGISQWGLATKRSFASWEAGWSAAQWVEPTSDFKIWNPEIVRSLISQTST